MNMLCVAYHIKYNRYKIKKSENKSIWISLNLHLIFNYTLVTVSVNLT